MAIDKARDVICLNDENNLEKRKPRNKTKQKLVLGSEKLANKPLKQKESMK